MQRYHNETILSTYQTKAAERRRDNLAKMENVLESIELSREMDDAFEVQEQKALNESFENHIKMENKNRRAKFDHSEIEHANNVYAENFDNLCKDLFFYVVFESLLIDDEIKGQPDNFNYIRESCNEFFEKMSSSNKLSIVEGSAFDDFMSSANRILTEQIESNSGVDIKKIIQRTILAEDMLMYYAIGDIKAKTAECLQNEKKSAIIKESLIKEDKYVDPSKTLFRYLFESNIKDVIEKSKERDPQALQDLSMVETILDYTILEAANTLQLVTFNNQLKKVINRVE